MFDPEEGGSPSEQYRDAARLTRRIFVEQADVHAFDHPGSLAHYYDELLAVTHADLTETRSVLVDKARKKCDFPVVAGLFHMIDDDTPMVLVTTYGTPEDREAVADLADRLRLPDCVMTPADHRLATRFSARLSQSMLGIEPVDTVGGVHIWQGEYDESSGLALGAAGFTM